MPKYYWFHCNKCGWEACRYRNMSKCPDCRNELVREPPLDFAVACWVCGCTTRLEMYAHRGLAGRIVGWLFACGKCAPHVADQDLIIEFAKNYATDT
jgi:hypothetical protein